MQRPIIGIVEREELQSDAINVTCVYDGVRNAVLQSGGNTIGILPTNPVSYHGKTPKEVKELNIFEKQLLEEQLELCDGILLQGGTTWYEYDSFIMEYAFKHRMPILGICLGMQLMTNYLSNEDKINDKTEKIHTDINHFDSNHVVKLDRNSILFSILMEEEIMVNSYHNFKAQDNKAVIKGYAKDGTPEVVEVPGERFMVGVQWDPEKDYDDNFQSRNIFNRFIDEAAYYKKYVKK